MAIKIVIADDHALLRQGIINVLKLEDDFQVIGEACDGAETVEKAIALTPDILLLDINMPRMNGLDVIKKINEQEKAIKIIVLTMHDDESYVMEVIKSGAVGYLLKDIEPGMLVTAIRTVYAGESYIYPTLAKRIFNEFSRTQQEKEKEKVSEVVRTISRREEGLTYREYEVLQGVCRGLSNQELAKSLFLSEKTVKNHLTNIFRKISVNDRTQAVLYAIKHKLVILE
ncbi:MULTISPECIES: response regulator [Pelosinus]|uniref:Response regulator receiver n=1 Tax=Pelosinus fermentans B4 TaxID=1149862 RepID=I9B6Z1_9FIRM|nr:MULTISPECIES: response regulator transcription factor [Pelosinus]EIW20887.1 response regulator receiver [Pelosinus fermentans B4]EIW27246.1 two component transcriptional regulator, LuxR family [Pelosinus fermentans A11]OAM92819.1 two component transcriptional regulator, LuxR family [Pelosinus fermentans DSM 17108]SDQ57877.1 DNA-binding response regulator, NarL/FixJ family, contains REC and HTH domains [Pelosinus fermentans]